MWRIGVVVLTPIIKSSFFMILIVGGTFPQFVVLMSLDLTNQPGSTLSQDEATCLKSFENIYMGGGRQMGFCPIKSSVPLLNISQQASLVVI